jgi:peptide/nickel transport system substrate-binding protein
MSLCVLIAALVMLAGPSIAAGQSTQDSRTLVVGVAFDIKSLDPARAFEPAGLMILKATYDTLLTLDEHDVSKIVPDLAESWEVSPDARTFTFHLRHGVTFQNSGNPMTSADVRWSLERAMGIHGNPSFLLDGITSIETPDDYTVVISKSDADPAFIAKASSPVFAVLDSKTVQAHGGTRGPDAATTDAAEDWLNQNSAGTGPFMMTSYTAESEIDVQGSATYWSGPPPFDRVIYRDIPDAETQKLTLEAGGIDIATTISADQVPSLQADPNISVVQGTSSLIFYLLMNEQASLSNGTMNNPDVQQAVRFALDYDGINKLIGGPAVTPPSVLPQGFLGAYPPERAIRRDVNRARDLLAKAGFPNGFNVDLEFPTDYSNSGVSFDVVAQKIQADLSDGRTAPLTPCSPTAPPASASSAPRNT